MADDRRPEPITELAEDLEIVRPLGRGSTAQVYLAREPALQRLVAVKVLRSDLAADWILRQRFEREAQSAARISHPNVTQIYRVGRLSTDVPYIVMEYIDGRTLRDALAARGALPLQEAKLLLRSLASALAAAHRQRIVHRDVRPSNVFIEHGTGRAVLGDFGIVALVERGFTAATRLTATGVLMGDVRYLSPEQIQGDPVTEQSDMYSFGILSYEALTGAHPYATFDHGQLIVAHLQERPSSLQERRPEVGAVLGALIDRCLSKDPNHRPRARDVVAALEETLGTGGGRSEPAKPPEPPMGAFAAFLAELRRRRVYQVLAAYGAVAFALLGGAQAIFDAFAIPDRFYRLLVGSVLAGFPAAMVLTWIYDISATGIRRTDPQAGPASGRLRAFQWSALALSVVLVLLLGWFLLREG